MNETTQLEFMAEQLGVKVILTTRYHAEFAGDGIEYAWGVSKSVYRKIPLQDKIGKDRFLQNVRKCISTENVLTKSNVRQFSKRARAYLLTYFIIAGISLCYYLHIFG